MVSCLWKASVCGRDIGTGPPGGVQVSLLQMWVSESSLFFLFFFFFCIRGVQKFPGKGSNPHHSSDPSHCGDSAKFLTHCTTRELRYCHFLLFTHDCI